MCQNLVSRSIPIAAKGTREQLCRWTTAVTQRPRISLQSLPQNLPILRRNWCTFFVYCNANCKKKK